LTTASIHSATAIADADSSVKETNEDNNCKVFQFTVYPPLPNLTIDTLYITPANPKTTDSITITAEVTNIGPGNSDSFRLCIEISGDTVVPQFSVAGLAAGASRSILRKTLLPIAQKYLITATADIDQKVVESNESNNDDYIFIEVTQQAWKQRSVWGRTP
jgi:subtilase family serine protease